MLVSDVQAEKANSSIDTFFPNFTFSKAVQPSNVPDEITLTESGRTIDFKLLQSKNAYSPISVISSPSITSVRFTQFSNAKSHILVTPPVITSDLIVSL